MSSTWFDSEGHEWMERGGIVYDVGFDPTKKEAKTPVQVAANLEILKDIGINQYTSPDVLGEFVDKLKSQIEFRLIINNQRGKEARH